MFKRTQGLAPLLACVVAISAFAPAAHGQGSSVGPFDTAWGFAPGGAEYLEFPQTAGPLYSATLTLTAAVTTSFDISNNSPTQTETFTAGSTGNVYAYPIQSTAPAAGQTYPASGTLLTDITLAGTDSGSIGPLGDIPSLPISSSGSQSITFTGSELAQFIGNGDVFVPVAGDGYVTFNAESNVNETNVSSAEASGTLTYQTTVPEPGTLAVLCSAMLSGALIVRRRYGRV